MGEQEHQDKPPQIRYEGGVPILDVGRQLSEVERKQDAAESRNTQYQSDQVKFNRRLVVATVGLVISTVAIGGIQVCYMHRQWKLTSDGLSKMGDQIWAAKDAAFAAQRAAGTSNEILAESKRQFGETLKQMESQTGAQKRAAEASKTAAESAKKSADAAYSVERPWLGVNSPPTYKIDQDTSTAKDREYSVGIKNFGTSPALEVALRVEPGNEKDFRKKIDGICSEAWKFSKRGFYIIPNEPYEYTQTSFEIFLSVGGPLVDKPLSAVMGCIVYLGTLGDRHHTEFCYVTEKPPQALEGSLPRRCAVKQEAD